MKKSLQYSQMIAIYIDWVLKGVDYNKLMNVPEIMIVYISDGVMMVVLKW